MRNSGKYFPYPVLCKENNDILNSELDFKFEIVEDKDFKCLVKVNLKNRTLKKLIKDGKANYLILIECPKTRFRKAVKFSEETHEFLIDEKLLQNRVEVASMIITTEELEYTNSDFNEDYEGDVFFIKRNNILAYGDDLSFDIERNTDSLENLPSIFVITENSDVNANNMELDLSETKIKVMLKSNSYELYKEIYADPNYVEILSSLFIVPALVNVLSQFDTLEDNYAGTNWYHSVNTRLKELKITPRDASESALSTAQLILGDTFEKTLTTLKDISIGDSE